MTELLCPAASPEGLRAAVLNGADAVYLGLGDFNARRNAKNFTLDEFSRATEFCRIRGVLVYVTINTMLYDRELGRAIEMAAEASQRGADALIVTDLGLIRELKRIIPDVKLHGSTQIGTHSLDGAKTLAAMGLSRVVLARELAKESIADITQNCGIETEVFIHGALCMSYSGQCYFSSVIGSRSGNRGMCAGPCRLPYNSSRGEIYPLSLRDNGLYNHIPELEAMGVSALKIEGRMKRAEYAALTAAVYSRLLREKQTASKAEIEVLANTFSREGFTDGYYTGKTERMFGRRADDTADTDLMRDIRKTYGEGIEYRRVPVKLTASAKQDVPVSLTAEDDRGNIARVLGDAPEPSFHRDLTAAELSTSLRKTGGTPYIAASVTAETAPGIFVNTSKINELRRRALSELSAMRSGFTPPPVYDAAPKERQTGSPNPPQFTVAVTQISQITKQLIALKPARVYIPIYELHKPEMARRCIAEGIEVTASLPHIIKPAETVKLNRLLEAITKAGINSALVHNIGQIPLVRRYKITPIGDYGLNIANSMSAAAGSELGLRGITLSFEMNLAQLRDISKETETELIVYGRLPLMLTENCVIKSAAGACVCTNFRGMEDRRGIVFPVIRESDSCRSIVLNSQKLFLADRLPDFQSIGLSYLRLSFTTENPQECSEVALRYIKGEGTFSPAGFTRGLFYK